MERGWYAGFGGRREANRVEGFQYFKDKNELHDIYEFCKELATYLKEEKVKNILFLDRSARPAWIGVDEYWNQQYPGQPKPGFYFTNPDGYEIRQAGLVMPDAFDLMLMMEHLATTGSLPAETGKTFEELEARFKEAYPNLMRDRTEPLALFDTCSHTGATMHTVLDFLQRIGFTDIRPITANDPDPDAEVDSAIRMGHKARLTSCYPFGHHNLVSKTDDIHSMPNDNNLDAGRRIRADIRKVMREGVSE